MEGENTDLQEPVTEPVKRPGSAKLAAANFKPFKALGQVANAIARTAGSAIALVEDPELRKKASDIVIGQANKGFNTVKQGVAHGAETVGQRIQAGPRQMQAVLGSLQKRIEEQRMANALREERGAPVDVQIGAQLYENAPQELRRRLWVALLDNASLSHSVTHSALSPSGSEVMGSIGRTSFRGGPGSDAPPGDRSGSQSATASPDNITPQQLPSDIAKAAEGRSLDSSGHTKPSSSGGGRLCEGEESGHLPPVRVSSSPQHDEVPGRPAETESTASPAIGSPRITGYTWASRKAGSGQTEVVKISSVTAGDSLKGPSSSLASESNSAKEQNAAEQQKLADASSDAKAMPETSSSSPPTAEVLDLHSSRPAALEIPSQPVSPTASRVQFSSEPPPSGAISSAASGKRRQSADEEAWEMVQEGSGLIGFDCSELGVPSLRGQPSANEHLGPEDVAIWQKLMIALSSVPPVSTEYAEDSRYNTLLQISIGQEETDDIISRDINRTFPEHPQFGYEQGQMALFRLLKAYSLHDLEVQYCQGMGFVAGVMLMYLPEEPAFRMLTRLLDERGPNLRRLYLPALEGLKHQLRCLDWLLERHTPLLAVHLQDNMVTPVLYASQWFLTLFACPFPSAFCARIIDIIMFTGSTDILLQTALAVVMECELELLEMTEFEDLLTHLKVEPVQWKQKRLRQVLNTAVTGIVTTETIRAADLAVSSGYCGSLKRRTASQQDLTVGSTPGGSRHSQSVAAAAILPTKPQAGSEGIDVAELSAALQDIGDCQGDSDDAAAASAAAPPILGADDLEMVLAVEMLRAPSEGRLTSCDQRLDPIDERSNMSPEQ